MVDRYIDLDHDTEMGDITQKNSIAPGITAITAADPAVVTVANDFSDGDLVAFKDVAGMVEINALVATVSSVSATGFTTDIDASGFTAHSGSAGSATLVSEIENSVRVSYDDTKTKSEIVDAVTRARDKITELSPGTA